MHTLSHHLALIAPLAAIASERAAIVLATTLAIIVLGIPLGLILMHRLTGCTVSTAARAFADVLDALFRRRGDDR